MKTSKFEELHCREQAGAGYDISASRSEATSQAANQSADTVFNFGSGDVSAYGGPQSNNPNATAVAARTAGDTTAPAGSVVNPATGETWHEKIDWPMVAIAFIAVAAIGGAIYYARQNNQG